MAASFTGQLLRPGDAGFPDAAVSRIFNQRRPPRRPAAVLRAAQRLGDLPHHRKADAGAFDSGLLGGGAPDKLVKDGALLLGADPHSPIAHGDRDATILHLAIHPYRAAFGRVFHGVFEQVPDSAPEGLLVGLDGGQAAPQAIAPSKP